MLLARIDVPVDLASRRVHASTLRATALFATAEQAAEMCGIDRKAEVGQKTKTTKKFLILNLLSFDFYFYFDCDFDLPFPSD